MSLIKGDDARTAIIQSDLIRTNIIVPEIVKGTGANNVEITGTLNLATFSGPQPQQFGSIYGRFDVLDVKGADGFPGQTVAFATYITGRSSNVLQITNLGPLNAVGVTVVPTRGSVGGQILCVAPGDWRLLSAAGLAITV